MTADKKHDKNFMSCHNLTEQGLKDDVICHTNSEFTDSIGKLCIVSRGVSFSHCILKFDLPPPSLTTLG